MGASHTLEDTHVEFFSDEDEPEVDLGNILNSYTVPTTLNTRIHKDHPFINVIGDVKSSIQTRRIEPKSIAKALSDSSWVEGMQEELLQFKLQQGHRQEEGIDYEEVFAPVARIEEIRLLLAYASFMDFLVYQIDVKSAFLYGTIEEEVYVTQPPGFKDLDHPNKVYKVVKALYGLHQAPRAWYETLANYLLGNGLKRGKIDQTLFIKKQKGDILLVKVYVDDIIFGSTNKELCIAFEKLMKDKFQMSSMGELTFFLGLQVQQKEDGIFISQDKYVAEILKKFNYIDVKFMIGSLMYLTTSRPDIMFAVCGYARFQVTPKTSHPLAIKRIFRYLKGKPILGLWKSTTGGCQFLGNRLISWQCKDQTVVVTSTTKAEYVAAASCCGQIFLQKVLMLEGSLGDKMERAATTASSLEAEQDSENPTIYTSLIQQFWETASASTLENEEMDITATIDGRVKTITEASIRRHLKLEDADGISSLPNTEIFEQLALMSSKKTNWEQFSSTIATAIICLATNWTFNFSKMIFEEDLQNDIKQTKLTYGAAYTKLILRVKKLEHKVKASKSKRRVRVIIFDNEEDLEDSYKQGRIIDEIDQNPSISLIQDEGTSWIQDDADIQRNSVDTEILLDQEEPTKLVEDFGSGEKGEKEISTTGVSTTEAGLSTVIPEVSTTVENLVYIRRSAEKRKDKGKAIMKEDEYVQKKTKKQLEQERLSHKAGIRLQEQVNEEERQRISRDVEIAKQLQNEIDTARQEQEKSDLEKALELQKQLDEREEVATEADPTQVIDWSDPAVLRYHAQQNRSFSKAEVRKNMCMYLKNQRGYKQSHFKGMSYEDIRPIFERIREVSGSVEEQSAREEKEVSEEELKKLLVIVTVEEVYIEDLQDLVKKKFSSTDPIVDKEKVLWVDLKRLFEPDDDDTLWKLQRYMHDH
ncbi:putative ribonuclease H-like domain-containing protein [Tanacetum coccineum]